MLAVEEVEKSNEKKINEKEEKKKTKKRRKKEKKRGKKILKFIFFLFFLILVTYLIYTFNFLGLGENIRSVLENIPIINTFLPTSTEELKSYDDILIELEQKNLEIGKLNDEIELLNRSNESDINELNRLKELENDYLLFLEAKNNFEMEVASGNPIEYKNYYSLIEPENAEEIYSQLVLDEYNEEEVKKYINRFETIDSSTSAQIMEQLFFTDQELVIQIIDNLSITKSAEILEKMDTVNSSVILKRLTPALE